MHLHPDAHLRSSRRGLVIFGAHGDSALLEHPLALRLPELLADDPDAATLLARLEEAPTSALVQELVEMGVLADGDKTEPARIPPRFALTRDGLYIAGIGAPASWVARRVLPAILSIPGRCGLGLLVVAGVVAFLAGRPDAPKVSAHPAIEGLLALAISLLAVVLHESGHAVALAHFGVPPTRAGFGFYWGSISFFVDSASGVALPRHQRVIQALAGLMVDVVTTSIVALAAHLVSDELVRIVLWRLAVSGLVNIAMNAAPVLQLDGHWALADLLDEPDLAARSRRALGRAVRGHGSRAERSLALYGILSLLGGVALTAIGLVVYWSVAGSLIVALLHGDPVEVALGLYSVVPLILGSIASVVGLILETVVPASDEGAAPATAAAPAR